MDDFSKKLNILQSYLKDWEERSGDTIVTYKRFIKEFFSFVNEQYGITKVEDIRPKHLIDWMRHLKEKGFKGSSINLKRNAIINHPANPSPDSRHGGQACLPDRQAFIPRCSIQNDVSNENLTKKK